MREQCFTLDRCMDATLSTVPESPELQQELPTISSLRALTVEFWAFIVPAPHHGGTF